MEKKGIQTFVICALQVEGFHRWPNAPEDPELAFLRDRHRHVFHIRMEFKVRHNDRAIEIIQMENRVKRHLHRNYGTPCEFEGRSCEDIATHLLKHYDAASVEVLEDGYGGARVVRG